MTVDDNVHYVYCICDPRKLDPLGLFPFYPFYIGYGKGDRIYSHYRKAKALGKLDKTNNTYKNILLKKIIEEGFEPVHIKLHENLHVSVAKELEKLYIEWLGRKDKGDGMLANLTDGGDGISNISTETRQRMSDAHKGQIPVNIEFLRNYRRLNPLPKKPRKPKDRKHPGKTVSEIAKHREANKTPEDKAKIASKISETIRRKGSKEPVNKRILRGSVQYSHIKDLFMLGLSVKHIKELVYPAISCDIIRATLRDIFWEEVKLYKRQSLEEALRLLNIK